MAGDWIKMRTDLLTSPKVVRMASALNADRFRIVGGLLSVWSLFDAHSADGSLEGYSLSSLEDLAAWPGFAAAMVAVGWLVDTGTSLDLPRFEAHNGASAKRRAQDADRKREDRKASASDADTKRTREEKRREDKDQDQKPSPSGSGGAGGVKPGAVDQPADDLFARFWALYPNRKGKQNAEKAWGKLAVTPAMFELITAALALQVTSAEWTKDGGQYIPHPATWLNGKRWDDEVRPGNVHRLPNSKHTNFDDLDYTAGTRQLEDGSRVF